MAEGKEVQECMFKVLVVGDSLSGKTPFVQRYVHGKYRQDNRPTIGVNSALKVIPNWSDELTLRLEFLDIAGPEKLGNMTRVYYKGAQGCIIMFDLTSPYTFDNAIKWKQDVDSKCRLPSGRPIPCVLVGNKSDLPSRPIPKETIDKVCKENSILSWMEVSAKEGYNVTQSMDLLIKEMVENYHHEQDGSKRTLADSRLTENTESGKFIDWLKCLKASWKN